MVTVYNILNVLSNFACDNFTEKFHIYVYQGDWHVIV